MRYSFLFLGILLLCSFDRSKEITAARRLFLQAPNDKIKADSLQKLSSGHVKALMKAYHGASLAILAKHYSNPYKKLDSVKKGINVLNSAVLLDASDIEIRFLRFSIEEHMPGFIAIEKHLDADKKMILSNLNKEHPFYQSIRTYLLSSMLLNEKEKQSIR